MKEAGVQATVNKATRQVTDFVGIDFATTSTKVVRLKKNKDVVSLVGIDLLPAVDLDAPPIRLDLTRELAAHYGCLAYTGTSAIVRMVNLALKEEETVSDEKLRELLNVGDDYRVSATLIKKGKGGKDSSFLSVAVPEKKVEYFLEMFSVGSPAASSIEVSGLSFISAFLYTKGDECADAAVCLIEAGDTVSYFAFINKGEIVLVGKFAVGGGMLQSKVVEDLGVDNELAETILVDQSVDISATLDGVLTPFLKQLSMSKDFIERHLGCRVSKVYASGGACLFPHWTAVLARDLHVEVDVWDPFEKIQCNSAVFPEELKKQSTRFAGAVGAAIGGLLG